MKDQTCEERIDAHLDDRIMDLCALWEKEGGEPYHDYVSDVEGDLNEYGLCFDYVEQDTFEDQPYAYWRYQLSWGGPSDEFRLEAGGVISYWFLDWFDGAQIMLRGGDLKLMRDIFEYFLSCQENRYGF
jgi:hypothetical protein